MTFESLRRYANYLWGVQQNQTMLTNCSGQYIRSFFFFVIKIDILFDKREIHVQTHNNPVSINIGEQIPVLQETKFATK